MWWIISVILLPLMIVDAGVITFGLMVMLNGYTSIPDALVTIYLVSMVGLVIGLSLLAGVLARKIAARGKIPLWVSGLPTGLAALVLLPVGLVSLTFVLMIVFGML